jgi:twitching motility protein PilT
MSKPVYEIPIGGGDDLSRPAGRRSAGNDFAAPQSSATPSFPPPAASTPDFAPPSYAAPTFALPSATPDFPPPGLAPSFPPPGATPDFPPPGGLAAPSPQNFAAQPVVLPSDLSPSVGLGQAGSDPDLVAALNAVVTSKGSDLHVSVNAPPSIRVDGGLRAVQGLPVWDANKVNAAILSIMSEAQKVHFAEELELDFAYTLSETSRFRVNVYLQRNVMGAAFRLIPTEIKQLAALGVPDRVAEFSKLARGLVLVTGPTGSGKSTTLAALIDLVNSTRSDHIVTVEDPIEFLHGNKKSLVNQREIGHDTHSFANALKHVLRQDPDVILIGELRDLETISVALTAAETGHLVFATLHTQDAAQTIDRVIDVFPPHQQGQVRAQLAATLQGVVCQTLVKKVGGNGRAVATEVLITTPAVSNLIREGKTFQIHSVMQAGREVGMHTMDQHLADLVNAGQISHQSAYEKAHDLEDLKQLIQRLGSNGGQSASASAGITFGDAYSKGN